MIGDGVLGNMTGKSTNGKHKWTLTLGTTMTAFVLTQKVKMFSYNQIFRNIDLPSVLPWNTFVFQPSNWKTFT